MWLHLPWSPLQGKGSSLDCRGWAGEGHLHLQELGSSWLARARVLQPRRQKQGTVIEGWGEPFAAVLRGQCLCRCSQGVRSRLSDIFGELHKLMEALGVWFTYELHMRKTSREFEIFSKLFCFGPRVGVCLNLSNQNVSDKENLASVWDGAALGHLSILTL